jgi:hypothetical protein
VPFGKWAFMVLALAPTALFQAATLNADGFTAAACFMFIGLTLKLALQTERSFRLGEVLGLSALAIMIGLSKPGYVMMLPLVLIIPRSCFASKKLYALMWAGVALAVLAALGWLAVSVTHSQFSEPGSKSVTQMLMIILADPVNFIRFYLSSIISSVSTSYHDWVGVYGYWVGTVPEIIYWLFPVALLLSLVAEPRTRLVTWKQRLFLAVMFLVSSGAVIFMFYTIHYTPIQDTFFGHQGRYFVPTAPLLFLALAGLVTLQSVWQKAAQYVAVGALVTVIAFFSLGLYAVYYTECGYSQFSGGSCSLPKYKNLDVSGEAPTFQLNAQKSLTQTFTNRCGELNSAGFYIKSVPNQVSGTLQVSVVDTNGQVLGSKEFQASQVQEGKFLSVPINPPAGTSGEMYKIRMSAPGLDEADSIGVLMRSDHYYPGGNTFSGGKQLTADAVFQYSCPN